MPGSKKALWRLVFLSYPCPTCGAGPGEVCHTASGLPYNECHADRTRNADRCPKCGAVVSAETPGQLCGHCQLVQDLLTERYHHHRRTT